MSKNKPSNTPKTPTEKQFFDLSVFLILDTTAGLRNMNADTLFFTEILEAMLEQELPDEKHALHQAYIQEDWESIEKLVHKMRGGAIYTGLLRLQYACEYFEIYYQRGQKQLRKKLYQQVMHTIEVTQQELSVWLRSR